MFRRGAGPRRRIKYQRNIRSRTDRGFSGGAGILVNVLLVIIYIYFRLFSFYYFCIALDAAGFAVHIVYLIDGIHSMYEKIIQQISAINNGMDAGYRHYSKLLVDESQFCIFFLLQHYQPTYT